MSNESSTRTISSKKRLILGAAIVAALLIVIAVWYFLYFKKTPSYSLGIVRSAVQTHDIVAFKKHVDLDTLLARGFDDFMGFYMEQDETMDANAKAIAVGFVNMLKQPITNLFKEATLRYVETNKWDIEQGNDKQPISVNEISSKTGLENASFKGVAYTRKDGKMATVGLNMFDENLNGTIILEVKMRKIDDGAWQIAELSNLKDYMGAVLQAERNAFKKYRTDTKPMVDKYNEIYAKLADEHEKIWGDKDYSDLSDSERKQLKKNFEDRMANSASFLKGIGTVKIPPAAVDAHDLRIKIEKLWEKFFLNIINFYDTNNEQLFVEALNIDKQITSEQERLNSLFDEANKHSPLEKQ